MYPRHVVVFLLEAILACSVVLNAALADEPMFHWVDDKGGLHITDRLHDVPEPFYGMYAARLKELAEAREREARPSGSEEGDGGREHAAARQSSERDTVGPSTAAPTKPPKRSTPAPPSVVSAEIARRDMWRTLVARWRRELAEATEQLHAVEQEVAEIQMNPLLRHTPANRARVAKVEPRREKARKRVLEARKMLLETIPARARKEQVPPLWLQ